MPARYDAASHVDGFIAMEDEGPEWFFPLGVARASSYPTFVTDVGALARGSVTYGWIVPHTAGAGSA